MGRMARSLVERDSNVRKREKKTFSFYLCPWSLSTITTTGVTLCKYDFDSFPSVVIFPGDGCVCFGRLRRESVCESAGGRDKRLRMSKRWDAETLGHKIKIPNHNSACCNPTDGGCDIVAVEEKQYLSVFLGGRGDKPEEKLDATTLSTGGYPSEMRGGLGIDPPFLGDLGFGDWWLFGAWETLTWR